MKSLSSSQPISKSNQIDEYKKSYLIEMKKEIENRRKIKEINKEDQIRKEKEMIFSANKQFEELKRKAELDEKMKKEEFVKRLNFQRDEKERKESKMKDERRVFYNSSIVLGSNDDHYNYSHSTRQGHGEGEENIRQDSSNHLNHLKKSYNQLHPDINYLYNKDYIYFKNKEIGHSGENSYKNKENMINEVINKYENQTKQQENHTKNNDFAKENVEFLSLFKKRKDQLLVKHLLDEQIKENKERKSNLNNEERLFNLKFQRTNLKNNVILNPIDDYNHNKYVNRLRVKEGVGFIENKQ